jgi:hypothetical protein
MSTAGMIMGHNRGGTSHTMSRPRMINNAASPNIVKTLIHSSQDSFLTLRQMSSFVAI